MIAVVFLLILVGIMVGMSFTGQAPSGELMGEILLLVGLFVLFFGMGIYVGAALGVLGLIIGYAFSDRPVNPGIGFINPSVLTRAAIGVVLNDAPTGTWHVKNA